MAQMRTVWAEGVLTHDAKGNKKEEKKGSAILSDEERAYPHDAVVGGSREELARSVAQQALPKVSCETGTIPFVLNGEIQYSKVTGKVSCAIDGLLGATQDKGECPDFACTLIFSHQRTNEKHRKIMGSPRNRSSSSVRTLATT